MQGKFQLVLMPKAGHAVHEDDPEAAAAHLAAFLKRFRVGEPPLVVPVPRAAGAAGARPAPPVLPIVAGPLHDAAAAGGAGGSLCGGGGGGGGAGAGTAPQPQLQPRP